MDLHIFTVGPWLLFALWADPPIMFGLAVALAVITLIPGLVEAIAILFSKKNIQRPKPSVLFGCLGFAGIIELYAILYAYDGQWVLQKVLQTIFRKIFICRSTSFIRILSV